ncbi:MAG: protein kinase [Deltaproteobacteria bacterium]|nr:protein kinase [Deltaproteobacteria bacterium]
MVPDLPDRYTVVRKIASGGMSEVYLCRLRREEGFEKNVAVKVIHPRLTEIARFREMFAREARIAASLSHQNLVQVFDFGKRGNSYYLAMEFVDGWNMAQAAAQMRLRSIPIPLPLWRCWVEGMLDGIGYLHSRKIIHRDVSPGNVLLSRGGAVKLTDFGIARGWHAAKERQEGWEGKFSYMSPEQARGEEADVSSDLFSAGVIAAEFFLPGRLFDGEGRDEILARLRDHDAERLPGDRFPPAISGILRKSMAQGKEDRYPDAGVFAKAIAGAIPETVSRTDLFAFWDLLFPGAGQKEEDTVVADALPWAGDAGLVREKRATYGMMGRRGVKIGVTSALVAASVGGVMWWKGSGPAEKEISPPSKTARQADAGAPPASSPPVSPPSRSRPRSGDVEQGSLLPGKRSPVYIETDPAGVSVGVDNGPSLGLTPFRLDTAPLAGKTVSFRKGGYATTRVSADALGQLPRFRIALTRLTGTLAVVQAVPWAKVYEGDRYLGVTPISSLELPVGDHQFRFVNEPLGVDRVETVTVVPGANPKLIVPLIGNR